MQVGFIGAKLKFKTLKLADNDQNFKFAGATPSRLP
jgi:hypothetical protein